MNIWNLDCICRVHCKINRLTNFGSLNYWLEVAFMKYNNFPLSSVHSLCLRAYDLKYDSTT